MDDRGNDDREGPVGADLSVLGVGHASFSRSSPAPPLNARSPD